jgi:Domain of unknown function (DUF4301)
MLLSPTDIETLSSKGISADRIQELVNIFAHGSQMLKLERPCTAGDGIVRLDASESHKYLELYENFTKHGSILKFVPASGAASRMFRHLYHYSADNLNHDTEEFILHFREFPFVGALEKKLANENISLRQLINDNEWQMIFSAILGNNGLGYADYPKGLVTFHKRDNQEISAFEEQLCESLLYARESVGKCRIHFSISPAHESLIRKSFEEILKRYPFDPFEVSFSHQCPSTDLPALTKDNQLARDPKGNIILRPAGHGALLKNLGELQADIIFIKNIDNVTTLNQIKDTVFYKKTLAGMLVEIKSKVFELLNALDAGNAKALDEAIEFIQQHFQPGAPIGMSREQMILYARSRLDRPIRICGMVRNEGEPGGGPFWIRMPDGQISKQIVEKNQVATNELQQSRIVNNSTHFNPVDIVCSIKNRAGVNYNLNDFVDSSAGIISEKFEQGKVIKALELPGLWNGSMAMWNTIFVEVPVSTFNPVKTVNDLLRSGHQSGQ